MANPSASTVAFVELAPHSLQIAVVSGRRLLALRSFALDARADIGAFVAEHGLAGVVRGALLGAHNFLHLSTEAESGAIRQPGALQGHAVRMPHGFAGAPFAAVVDAAAGFAPDPTRVSPWLLSAVDAAAAAVARDSLGELGLAPADLVLAAPSHLGVVAASLGAGETALVLVPGEERSHLVWVASGGVQSVVESVIGFSAIFAAVQQGLGLKFKAAAGKLFYNVNYDFTDAAPKIGAIVAAGLKSALETTSATHLHVAGLLPSQSWLVEQLAANLGLKVWAPAPAAVAARLNLDLGAITVPSSAVPLLPLIAAGSGDSPWVQSALEVLIAKSKTVAPFVPKVAPAPVSEPVVVAEPVPVPAPVPALTAAPAPVESVRVSTVEKPADFDRAPARKEKTGRILIAATVGVVAAVVGVAAYFRSSPRRDEAKPTVPPAVAPSVPEAPAAPAKPDATPVPAPVKPSPAATPAPSSPQPVASAVPVATVAGSTADLSAGQARRFSNERYHFDVTEKGFIQALASARDEVLVESAAGVSLQGSYVGTDGRRKWFNVGGVDDASYQATVQKTVEAGVTVFKVRVTHSRFELDQTFRCLPASIKVSASFTPINLRDPRGAIAAVHSVRLSPVALNPAVRMRPAPDSFAYTLKSGALAVSFDNGAWARDGADGRQTVNAGENGVAFQFTDSPETARRTLNYEITLP